MDDTTFEQMPTGPVDVVVVGGGLAGLAAATTAAGHGASVTLLEARSLGGRASSADRDGFTLNTGAHALYRGAGGGDVLDRLSVTVAGQEPPLGNYRMVWDGDIIAMPMTPGAVVASRLFSPRSKVQLGRWMGSARRLSEAAGDLSLGEWMADRRAAPNLERFLMAVLRLSTYSARPDLAPASAMLRQLAAATGGVRYLDGGWQSLVDALARAALQAGVRLIDHVPVRNVEEAGAGWVVDAGDGTISAAALIVAAGGPRLASDLIGIDPGWVEQAGPPQRAACLDIGTEGPADARFLLSTDEPLYLSEHAPLARLAPHGRHLSSLMRYLAADDDSSAEENRRQLDDHARAAGLPAPEGRVIDRFLAAPVVSWGSPTVGLTRPTGHELAHRSVFAAGDWIGDALLADASLTSGEAAGLAAARTAADSRSGDSMAGRP